MSFQRSTSQRVLRSVSNVLGAPFRWLALGGKRLTKNWRYGKIRNLLLGLPAVVVVASFLWLSALVRANPEALRKSYVTDASAAITAQNYGPAEIYLQRVLDDFGTSDPLVEFYLAQVLESTGRSERAELILQRIAPDTGGGFGPAHTHRALQFSARAIQNQSSADVNAQAFYQHLIHADERETPRMQGAWATYLLMVGQPDQAVAKLLSAVEEEPRLYSFLGEVYIAQREVDLAREAFANAAAFYQERLNDPRELPNDTADRLEYRYPYANLLMRLGELDECERVLLQGLQMNPDGPYKLLLAGLYTAMHDRALAAEEPPIKCLQILSAALANEPNFQPAYDRLLLYADITGTTEDGEPISTETILNEFIASGTQSGFAHFAMSQLKMNQGDLASSRRHLERAFELLPNMPFIANNMAWTLATEEPVDLDKALEIIGPVVEKYSNDHRLLDTRATIFMKLDRWEDAYDDLERALQVVTQPAAAADLHEKLATVCDELEQTDLAAAHRKLAEQLRAAAEAAAAEAEAEADADAAAAEDGAQGEVDPETQPESAPTEDPAPPEMGS